MEENLSFKNLGPYVPYQMWPEYKTVSDIPKFFKPEEVNYGNVFGIKWRFGPFCMEQVSSDIEPNLTKNTRQNIRFWQRIYRTDIPNGWHTGFFPKSPTRIGYSEIKQNEYWQDWPENTRYYRRKWLNDFLGKKYTIEEVPLAEYKEDI